MHDYDPYDDPYFILRPEGRSSKGFRTQQTHDLKRIGSKRQVRIVMPDGEERRAEATCSNAILEGPVTYDTWEMEEDLRREVERMKEAVEERGTTSRIGRTWESLLGDIEAVHGPKKARKRLRECS